MCGEVCVYKVCVMLEKSFECCIVGAKYVVVWVVSDVVVLITQIPNSALAYSGPILRSILL